MSVWSVKKFTTKTIKGYKIPKIKDLKQGETYYTKDPCRSTMNNKWVFDPDYHESVGLKSYYIRDIESQIKSGLIWVKVK